MTIKQVSSVLALTFTVTACGDSPTRPSAPQAAPQVTSPATAEANIVSVGSLYRVSTYRNSPTLPVYLVDGVGQNTGVGCAAAISGTLTMEGSATVSWALPAQQIVTAGSQFWYTTTVEHSDPVLARKTGSFVATFRWTSVECPKQ